MNAKSPTIFQNGVIDVFKGLKVYDLDTHGVNYNGEVASLMVCNKKIFLNMLNLRKILNIKNKIFIFLIKGFFIRKKSIKNFWKFISNELGRNSEYKI
jgi:hypothetical protein